MPITFNRNDAIDTICSNLVQAGILEMDDIAITKELKTLMALDDRCLAIRLINSHQILEVARQDALKWREN